MNFLITKWHEENPNDWCAISPEKKGLKLYARADSLMDLRRLVGDNEVVYVKAWQMHISKDYPLSNYL